MMFFLDALSFAIGVTLPSVLLLLLGVFLRRSGQIGEDFLTQACGLVFHYGLPLLLFSRLVEGEIDYAGQAVLLTAGAVTTLILYLAAECYAYWRIVDVRDRGVFVQGVFRSNMGIMGLAFVMNAYGKNGLAAGAVYMGVITVLYNILAVLTLSRTQSGSMAAKAGGMLKKILGNPLIVAIVTALLLQYGQIRLPAALMQTAAYVGDISLPLALICAGAAFDWRSVAKISDISLQAAVGRLLLAPMVAVAVGLAFGLQGIPMGVLFLMVATPVASASYVMAKAMGGNDVAAANIVGLTTFGAMFSAALGILLLRCWHLM